MACGLQGSRKGSEVGSSREIRPYGLTVYNTNCVHCNTVVVTNWPMKEKEFVFDVWWVNGGQIGP